MKCFFIVAFLIFISQFLSAQDNWKILDSTNSPLKFNLIRYVESDSYGNIWLGTDSGLYKFDGVFWTNYNTGNSPIPYDQVDNFYLDRYNNIWFIVGAQPYAYFKKFDGNNWETIDSSQTCYPLHSYYGSRDFVIDSYETKWIRTSSNIIRYDGFSCIYFDLQSVGIRTTEVNKIDLDLNDNFTFISQDYDFNLLGGIAKTDSAGWLLNHLQNELPLDFSIDSPHNFVWISTTTITDYYLFKLTYDDLQISNTYQYPQSQSFGVRLVSDINGNVWQSSKTYYGDFLGLQCFLSNDENWILFNKDNSPLPSNYISYIAVDIQNDKLVATDKGLAVYNELGISFPEQLTDIDTLIFGDVGIANSESKELMLYNHYGYNLTIDSLNFISPVFSVNTSLPAAIPPGDSISLVLNFQPDSIRNYSEKIIINTGSGMYAQLISGNGVPASGIMGQEKVLKFYLSNNYPNPFNPTTNIKYQISVLSKVKLTVYDILGREITTLVNEEKPAGSYEVEFDASDLSSGVYIIQLRSNDNRATKKLMLAK